MPLAARLRHLFAYHRGRRLLRLEAWSKAAESLARAGELAPGHAPSHALEAAAHARLELFERAEAAARRAVDAASGWAGGHACLARVLLDAGRAEDAEEAAQRAIELDPTHAAAHAARGRALVVLGRPEDGAEALLRALEAAERRGSAAEGTTAPCLRAALADAAGRLPAGVGPTAERAPDRATGLLLEGLEAWKRGSWEAAARSLANGEALAGDDPVFAFLRVEPLLRLGRNAEAAAAGRTALSGAPLPLVPGAPAVERLTARRVAPWGAAGLGPRPAHYAHALAALAPLEPGPDPRPPRLLCVLDEDYGELTTLMLLLLGQPVAERALLAMPARLAERNAGVLGGRTRVFSDFAGLRELVAELDPDGLLLCSAYLFGVHGLCEPSELTAWLTEQTRRGRPWATTDPFLGLLGEGAADTALSISLPPGAPPELDRRRREDEALLRRHFNHAARLCAEAPHVYPAPDTDDDGTRRRSFANPALVIAAPEQDDSRPSWLFVLSRTDLDTQLLHAGAEFPALVTARMVDAVAAGRRALLVGPDALLDAVAACSPLREDLELLPFCSFEDLAALTLAAECAFYWNALSHSILLRLWNGLPVVLFDRGHLIRNLPALEQRIERRMWQGIAPPYANPREAVGVEEVEAWRRAAAEDAGPRRAGLRDAPTPQALVAGLMAPS